MKQILSWSGGKDSTASIILCKENNISIDEIVYAEIWYDKSRSISGENPDHIRWMKEYAIPLIKSWGYKVSVVSNSDYVTGFTKAITRGTREGKLRAYPISSICWVRRGCKIKALRDYIKTLGEVSQIIGFGADETKRCARLKTPDWSVLEKLNITEAEAFEICKAHNLLSPIYSQSGRGGCWFCPNAKKAELLAMLNDYPEYWSDFLSLAEIPNLQSYIYKYGKTAKEVNNDLMKERTKQCLKK